MMDNKLTLSKMDSAEVRRHLENRLAVIFSDQTICKYLMIDGCGPELQLLTNCDPKRALPQMKLAFRIWSEMETPDRHNVLFRFHQLYAGLPIIDSRNRKILIFCALFVHEFTAVLTEISEWPD